jgi:hypothetical protein
VRYPIDNKLQLCYDNITLHYYTISHKEAAMPVVYQQMVLFPIPQAAPKAEVPQWLPTHRCLNQSCPTNRGWIGFHPEVYVPDAAGQPLVCDVCGQEMETSARWPDG